MDDKIGFSRNMIALRLMFGKFVYHYGLRTPLTLDEAEEPSSSGNLSLNLNIMLKSDPE